MKSNSLIKVIINLFGVSIVFPLTEFFAGKEFNVILAGGLATAISVIIIELLEYIFLDVPYRFLWFRKHFFPISKLEGAWVEVSSTGERVISIAHIKYDHKNKRHTYSGCSYSKDGTQKATWNASTLIPDSNDGNNAFTFLGKGKYVETKTNVNVVGQVICRPIDPLNPNNLNIGHASYYDYGFSNTDKKESEDNNIYIIYKLNSSIYKEVIGKRKISSLEDEKNFVIKYYKEKADELFDKVEELEK